MRDGTKKICVAIADWLLLNWLVDQLLPHLSVLYSNWKVARRIQIISDTEFCFAKSDGDVPDATLEDLKSELSNQLDRRNRIVDKARSALFIIGITVAIMIGSLNLAKADDVGIRLGEMIMLAVSVAYLMLSTLTVTAAVNVSRHYGRYLEGIVSANGGELKVIKKSTAEQAQEMYRLAKLNEDTMIVIANHVFASYVGIRNGIVLIVTFFAMVMSRVSNL